MEVKVREIARMIVNDDDGYCIGISISLSPIII